MTEGSWGVYSRRIPFPAVVAGSRADALAQAEKGREGGGGGA